jgi:stalled ribosome alternative rescue factor ArfA
LEQIQTAKDLTSEEYEELSSKKKMSKTTTEENLQIEKKLWQHFFLTSELKEDILQNFIYDQNPFKNFLSLIDFENYEAEDNIRTEKQRERVNVVDRLLQLLGFESPRDETQIKKETVRENFAEKVVNDPLFKQQKRLNALFDLEKAYNIHGSMTPQQILMWVNSLLKPFSLQIKAGEKTYQLELQNDLMSLIQRKNKNGREYKDRKNLLNQRVPKKQVEEDLFMDDETRAKKAKKPFNTDLLDVGINHDDE